MDQLPFKLVSVQSEANDTQSFQISLLDLGHKKMTTTRIQKQPLGVGNS